LPLANPFARYQQTAATTADGGDLLILTYEALLRWLSRAQEAIDAGNLVDAHQALMYSQDLILNLSTSLDFERGGDIAINLQALYQFLSREIVQANVDKDSARIGSVRELIAPLLDAWRAAVPMARKQGQLANA
jgi:flagellar secretion chaperone FliS